MALTFSNPPPPPSPSPPLRRQASSVAHSSPLRPEFRIRETQVSDLPQIASILATASQQSRKMTKWNNWKARIDRLFAKADIEALITSRFYAVAEGKKAYQKVQTALQSLGTEDAEDLSERDKLRLLWTQTSDKFRTNLDTAVRRTGEDNVWRRHNLQLPPEDHSWLRHLQLTAFSPIDGAVVGFCEVAVLWNPVGKTYSPAIANLATAPSWRRRGVATRLLRIASRFVSIHWNKSSNSIVTLGLFVEKENAGALALYEKLGFAATATSSGGDFLGEMWYMSKDVRETPSSALALSLRS
jgi:ribosomal protein S18 acetylase RimI-like enzyme